MAKNELHELIDPHLSDLIRDRIMTWRRLHYGWPEAIRVPAKLYNKWAREYGVDLLVLFDLPIEMSDDDLISVRGPILSDTTFLEK
jgi:hypothetical protein